MDQQTRDIFQLIHRNRIGATMIEHRRDGTRRVGQLRVGSLFSDGSVGFGWLAGESSTCHMTFDASRWKQELEDNVLFLTRLAPDTRTVNPPHAKADLYMVVFVR